MTPNNTPNGGAVREPYVVEIDSPGCESCDEGKTWTVVGPDGVAESESWYDEEVAAHFADRMNAAFRAGRAALPAAPGDEAVAPIGYAYENDVAGYLAGTLSGLSLGEKSKERNIPLYTHPPALGAEWTMEDAQRLWQMYWNTLLYLETDSERRAIIAMCAALKSAFPQGRPAATRDIDAEWPPEPDHVVTRRPAAVTEGAEGLWPSCHGCGKALLMENLFCDDGCPCNSARGINLTPKPCSYCGTDNCVKPGHRLAELFGIEGRPAAEIAVTEAEVEDRASASAGDSIVDRYIECDTCEGGGLSAPPAERESATQAKGDAEFPITGRVWFRESTDEWVLELCGSINDTSFICRHVEPKETKPEDVPWLPSYAPSPAREWTMEDDDRLDAAVKAFEDTYEADMDVERGLFSDNKRDAVRAAVIAFTQGRPAAEVGELEVDTLASGTVCVDFDTETSEVQVSVGFTLDGEAWCAAYINGRRFTGRITAPKFVEAIQKSAAPPQQTPSGAGGDDLLREAARQWVCATCFNPEIEEIILNALSAPRNAIAPDGGETLSGDAKLAHDQCRAVVYMARALADVYSARVSILEQAKNPPVEIIGQSSAYTMEWLGNELDNMDAVDEADEWMDPIFEAAQARWPEETRDAPSSPRAPIDSSPAYSKPTGEDFEKAMAELEAEAPKDYDYIRCVNAKAIRARAKVIAIQRAQGEKE